MTPEQDGRLRSAVTELQELTRDLVAAVEELEVAFNNWATPRPAVGK